MEENVKSSLHDLDLHEHFPRKITFEQAETMASTVLDTLKDIPGFFLKSVFDSTYDGRCTFHLGQKGDSDNPFDEDFDDVLLGEDPAEENEDGVLYGFLDVTVLVFLCCDDDCKQRLAEKMAKNNLSVPLLIPPISSTSDCILQQSVLRGIALDGFEKHDVPIVSFMAVNGLGINKTRIANTLICSVENYYQPFNDIDLQEQSIGAEVGKSNMTNHFEIGTIDAVYKRPKRCTCNGPSTSAKTCWCTFSKEMLLLNLYGFTSSSKSQRDMLCKVSSLVCIFVDTGDLKGNPETIEEIKQIIELSMESSNKTLILLTKEESSSFQDCQDALKEMHGALKGLKPQVSILFDRASGARDNLQKIRSNVIGKINYILQTITPEATLKDVFDEKFTGISTENVHNYELP